MSRPPQHVTVGLVQMSCGEDREANIAKALTQIETAANQGAQIVGLQELFAAPYPCQTEDHDRFDDAESIPGPTTERLAQTARRCEVVVVGSLFERRAAGLYHNSAVVLDADGSLVGIYRKMHIPDDPQYYEKFYFTPGDLGFRAFDTRVGRIGICVCWDQWFPEAARLTALEGAQLLFYPTAIGWLPSDRPHAERCESQLNAWTTMMRSHAIANGVFVAATNRVATERTGAAQIDFWGSSFVADPYGNLIGGPASREAEATLVVTCDLGQVDTARVHWPFLRDRRIDAYQGLLRRYGDDATHGSS